MRTEIPATLPASRLVPARDIKPETALWIAIGIAVLACLPAWNLGLMVPADTVWLLHAGERFLAGDRLYVDVIETNPPMSVLLYLPALTLADLTGLSNQMAAIAQTVAVAGISLALSAVVLRQDARFNPAVRLQWLLVIGLVILFVPNASFTQREHYGLMLLLPYVLLQWRRSVQGRETRLSVRLVIGALAGLAVCIKPHFLAVPVFTALTCSVVLKSWRPLFAAENWVGLAAFAGYATAALWAFPEFFGAVWPLLSDVYLQAKKPILEFLLMAPPSRLWFALAAIMAYALLRLTHRKEASVLLAAIAGFTLVFWSQGKGFIYHVYPASGLAVITLAGIVLLRRTADRTSAIMIAACSAVALFASTMGQREPFRAPGLLQAMQSAPSGATLVTVSSSMEVTIGLLGQTELEWASRLHLRWITYDVEAILKRGAPPEAQAKLAAYIALDRQMLAEDLAKKPDLIVFDRYDRDWENWARQDNAINALLNGSYGTPEETDGGLYRVYRLNSGQPS